MDRLKDEAIPWSDECKCLSLFQFSVLQSSPHLSSPFVADEPTVYRNFDLKLKRVNKGILSSKTEELHVEMWDTAGVRSF